MITEQTDLSRPSIERSKLALELLDKISDAVLAYKPKPKTKAQKRRARKKRAAAND